MPGPRTKGSKVHGLLSPLLSMLATPFTEIVTIFLGAPTSPSLLETSLEEGYGSNKSTNPRTTRTPRTSRRSSPRIRRSSRGTTSLLRRRCVRSIPREDISSRPGTAKGFLFRPTPYAERPTSMTTSTISSEVLVFREMEILVRLYVAPINRATTKRDDRRRASANNFGSAQLKPAPLSPLPSLPTSATG